MLLQAPSRDTIHCNHIAKYVLRLRPSPDQGEPRTWDIPASSTRMMSIPGLKPFTEYCATVSFRTDGGFESPTSEAQCVVTPQTSRSFGDGERVLGVSFEPWLRTGRVHADGEGSRVVPKRNTEGVFGSGRPTVGSNVVPRYGSRQAGVGQVWATVSSRTTQSPRLEKSHLSLSNQRLPSRSQVHTDGTSRFRFPKPEQVSSSGDGVKAHSSDGSHPPSSQMSQLFNEANKSGSPHTVHPVHVYIVSNTGRAAHIKTRASPQAQFRKSWLP